MRFYSKYILPHYDKSMVSHLTAIDPLEELWTKRRVDLSRLGFEVKYLKGSAEEIPAVDGTFDTVVSTFTLCSVNDVDKALKEIHRVLKPGGESDQLYLLGIGIKKISINQIA